MSKKLILRVALAAVAVSYLVLHTLPHTVHAAEPIAAPAIIEVQS